MTNEVKNNYDELMPQEILTKMDINFKKSIDGKKFFINAKENGIEKDIAIYQQKLYREKDKFQWKAYERSDEKGGNCIGNVIDTISKIKKMEAKEVMNVANDLIEIKPTNENEEKIKKVNKLINEKFNCEIVDARRPNKEEIPKEFAKIPIEFLAVVKAKFQNFRKETKIQKGIAVTDALYKDKDNKLHISKYPTGAIKLREPFLFVNKNNETIVREKLAINQNAGKYIYQKCENANKLVITNSLESFAKVQGKKDTSIIYTNNLRNTYLLDKQIEKLKPQLKSISFEYHNKELNKTQEKFKNKILAISKGLSKTKAKSKEKGR